MKSNVVRGLASVCALAIPLSAAADESTFDVYGSVEVRTVSRDNTDLDTFVSTARLGLKGVQHLSSALDLRWQLEFDLPKNSTATDSTDTGDVSLRKGSISLQGGFGELILGRQNNLASSAKKIDTFKNDSGAFLLSPDRLGNAIGYVTPSLGGAKVFLQLASDADAANSAGVGEDNDVDATVFGVEYANDVISGTLAKYSVDSTFPSGEVDLTSMGLSVALGSASIFTTYQDESVQDEQVVGIGVAYGADSWTYKLGMLSFEDNTDKTEGSATYLLANYGFGNGVNAFVQYVDYDSSAESTGKGDAISVGISTSVGKSFTY